MADKSYKLKFTLSNSTNIEAGTVVAKQGAKGSKGATGDPGADRRTVTFSSSVPRRISDDISPNSSAASLSPARLAYSAASAA